MPMPQEYQIASQSYDKYLRDLCEESELVTRNRGYTCTQAVLLAFRKRLTAEQVLLFANVLPVVLRAIFTKEWQREEYTADFGDEADWIADIKGLRARHNFSEDATLRHVSGVLLNHVDEEEFRRTLQEIGPEALRFWGVEALSPIS